MRCGTCVPVIGSPAVEGLPFPTRLAAGHLLVGTVVTLPDVTLAELSASAVDFVWIDLEHGALGTADVAPLAIAARAAGAASLVRLRAASDPALGPALDAGVDGVVVPRVERAAQAATVVKLLRHPPRGSRGRAVRRDVAYGRDAPAAADPVCMVQIESREAVEAADSIAGVEGVGALVVGCADLAASLDADPEALSAPIGHVQRAAHAAGVASGVAGPDDPEALARLAGGSSTVLVLGADVRNYARAIDRLVARLREELPGEAREPEEAHVGT
jgi:4-hydroxy-2-oxoheptanedioate aldolase